MYPFRRPFRLLEILFPGSGISGSREFPVGVDEIVTPVWNISKPRPGDVYFDSRALTANVGSAGTFELLTTLSPVPAGRVRIVTSGAVFNGDAATRQALFKIVQRTGVAAPPWGSWWGLAGGTRYVSAASIAAAGWATTRNFPLWFEDTDIGIDFLAMTGGGENVQFHFTFVEIPGELIDVEIRNLT